MKIAVISDIHDRMDKLNKTLEEISKCKIDTIICCGDIATKKTVMRLAQTNLHVFSCLGNAEREPDEIFYAQNEYKNLTVFRDLGEIKLAGKTIGFTHYPQRAKDMAQSGAYDFVFYGHTHTPWIKMICHEQMRLSSQSIRHLEQDLESPHFQDRILNQFQSPPSTRSGDDDNNRQCSLLLNPGEIASHFGRQSTFAIVDLETGKTELKIIV
ncbi:TPA: hypothetical protein DDW69_04725 [candidate division CPR2 bacterium]|uniref:Phosphodiesterase, MJ0936 family protein n=1 Tax=candidate division CPR2 bacterium GW2011_GWC1_41_48 TaxID=1618344 RepID=A0A0G0W8P2_UNCC2|nr:MAG: phosphodiesterase, MJ0936 family protein [candidate division CPR2 bacterium GW2011_GWC2_39_35]KKR27271.1 MAG: phosphodiesterase, MJ0936 family protein [candidate division CPR2 bacterium GW2011_GWD1_39_7]KKR28314.1 MAG: phosphodiesterase, MJ0936 family protein [candidate division CPR2 bacterium GW2011_GWD2_39_7]KKS09350.1 MAG: phosphodiesterase, MJ0936 family protein [candidate division CPR2 bacterium GW2011_GWC1_41_48]OGB57785.1 MAG: hypothetical protein A2Y27_02565 [candidate division 